MIFEPAFARRRTMLFWLNLDSGQNKKDPKKGMVGEKIIRLNEANPRDIKAKLELNQYWDLYLHCYRILYSTKGKHQKDNHIPLPTLIKQ